MHTNENLIRPMSQKSSNEGSINGQSNHNNLQDPIEVQKAFQKLTSQFFQGD